MTKSSRAVVAAVSLFATASMAQVLYDQGPPQHRIVHRNTFALRYNPLGLLYDGRFMYRYRLYESESLALRDNFVGVGIAPTASPAFVRIGPYVEVNPLTVLGLWATVQFVQYFGTFNLFQSFPSASSNFSDREISSRGALPAGDPQRAYVTNGWELAVGANFQVKISSVLVRSLARLARADMRLRDGDRVYYDQFYDLAAPNRGWYFTNDLDVLWQGLGNKMLAGARYTMTLPFYDPNRHIADGETVPDNSLHRVGPFIGYTFKIQDGARFNTPTVFVLVQWWLRHRWRTGADTPQALPVIGAGFQMTGDFLPIK